MRSAIVSRNPSRSSLGVMQGAVPGRREDTRENEPFHYKRGEGTDKSGDFFVSQVSLESFGQHDVSLRRRLTEKGKRKVRHK